MPQTEKSKLSLLESAPSPTPASAPPVVERVTEIVEVQKTPTWLAAFAVIALLLSALSMAWVSMLQSHVSVAETTLAQADAQNKELRDQVAELGIRLKSQGEALGQRVGLTQKQLDERANSLIAEQKNTVVATSKLAQHQNLTDQKVQAVQNDVAAVRSDVTAVKTDVATTQADIVTTKKQITQVVQAQTNLSTDIATNRKELNTLKQRGDRTYYEFAIEKGAPAINLGTIKLSVKKVDVKNSKFTLVIGSDDKNIEKADKSLNEAITFYSGKKPELFEVVVNGISKKMIAGYLSVPKDAPKPIQ